MNATIPKADSAGNSGVIDLQARREKMRADFDVLDRAAADPAISATAFKLLYVIRSFINRETGVAWPTQQTLADRTGVKVRMIRMLSKALVDGGYLNIEAGCGRGSASRYRLQTRQRSAGYVPEKAATQCRVDADKPGNTVPLSQSETRQSDALKPAILCTKTGTPLPTELLEEPSEEQGHNNIDREFDELFWPVYPKRVSKEAARRAWRKARRRAIAQTIVDGALAYHAERTGQDLQFTKHPATWLNGGCWEDEPSPQAGQNDRKPNRISAAIERQFERLQDLGHPSISDGGPVLDG